jgi:hypothetical protein
MTALAGMGALGLALMMPPAGADSANLTLSEADKVAIFKSVGAVQRKGRWLMCDPPADSGAPASEGAIFDTVRDLNGDGHPEVVISDSGTYCYGTQAQDFNC